MDNVSWIVDLLRRIARDMALYSDGRCIPEDTLDSFEMSLELAYHELLVLETTAQLSTPQREACGLVSSAITSLRTVREESTRSRYSRPFNAALIDSGSVGRPSFTIPYSQLRFLIENQFTTPQIAEIMGTSVRTIQRKMSEYGLSIREQFSTIPDQQLDDLVMSIQQQFPMCGNQQMRGHLRSRGFHIQQYRVRESQRRVDPEGTILRRLTGMHRRNYSVPFPRSLYHIDGNHKLIRYMHMYV